jgi:hypothetical protein
VTPLEPSEHFFVTRNHQPVIALATTAGLPSGRYVQAASREAACSARRVVPDTPPATAYFCVATIWFLILSYVAGGTIFF